MVAEAMKLTKFFSCSDWGTTFNSHTPTTQAIAFPFSQLTPVSFATSFSHPTTALGDCKAPQHRSALWQSGMPYSSSTPRARRAMEIGLIVWTQLAGRFEQFGSPCHHRNSMLETSGMHPHQSVLMMAQAPPWAAVHLSNAT